MKYSLAFVAYFLALALQCSARPQPQVDLSAPAAPAIPTSDDASGAGSELTDVGTGTEASLSGDQVVFDDSQANQGDSDSAGVTTDMPLDDESQDGATTMSPQCEGEECVAPSSSVLKVEEVVPAVGESVGDAGPAPSDDDSEAANTTPASVAE